MYVCFLLSFRVLQFEFCMFPHFQFSIIFFFFALAFHRLPTLRWRGGSYPSFIPIFLSISLPYLLFTVWQSTSQNNFITKHKSQQKIEASKWITCGGCLISNKLIKLHQHERILYLFYFICFCIKIRFIVDICTLWKESLFYNVKASIVHFKRIDSI